MSSTLQQVLQSAALSLQQVSDTARLDAELLLAEVLRQPRAYLYTYPEKALTLVQHQCFQDVLQRRQQGEPVAYILGHQEFWSLDLAVTPDTLIPRSETEHLVEATLDVLVNVEKAVVADLGTGSGAIALALASERSQWHMVATDRCCKALQVAESNAIRLGFNNVSFKAGNWCAALPQQLFHAIVSNPPYIAVDDPHLQQGDLRSEPQKALVAEEQGLADLSCIIRDSADFLVPGGYLLLEHGYQQGTRVEALLHEYGYVDIARVFDLGNRERVAMARRAGKMELFRADAV